MIQHIERYTAAGWYLLPIQAGDKRPLLKDWVNTASSDRYVALDWLKQYPGMNLGVACGKSGFFVIDVDKKADGMESFVNIQRSQQRFTPTLTARTAGGGLHLLYKASPEFNPRNVKLDKIDRRLKGIETRGDGGQIVIAPSFNVAYGKAYEWDNNLPIAEPPRWLIEMMTKKPSISQRAAAGVRRPFEHKQGFGKPMQRLEGAASKLSSMGENSGRNIYLNNAVYGIALEAAKGNINPDYVIHRMRQAARASGLTEVEIEATIKSAMSSAYRGKKE